jgi:Ala-tRNA(Pro) deacylase
MYKKLKELLDHNRIKYQVIMHSTAYTAQEIAAQAHVPGSEMAKVVIVKTDNGMIMTVLPASHIVDLRRVKEITGASTVALAEEEEYAGIMDECEPGGEPPFGEFFGMKVYMSTVLSESSRIVFNAGNHRELVSMATEDYLRLVKPEISSFSIKEQIGKKDRHSEI